MSDSRLNSSEDVANCFTLSGEYPANSDRDQARWIARMGEQTEESPNEWRQALMS